MKLFLALFLCFNCATFLSAQETALKKYQENSIYLQQGFGGYRYVKAGKVYPKGFLLAYELKQELEVSPNAIIEFKKYRKSKFVAIGFGLLSYGLLAVSISNTDNINSVTTWISFGTAVTSGLLSLNSRNKLQKSIWLYNQDILR